MNSSYKNRTLWIVLVVLTALFAVVFINRNRKRTSSFDPLLYRLDTARVYTVEITPAGGQESPVRLYRDSLWLVSQADVVSKASPAVMENILQEMVALEATRILGRGKDRWDEFQVGDSLGTKVVFQNEKDKTLAQLYLGNLRFKQSPPASPAGRPNIQPYTPVRVQGDHSVYAVEGYLAMTFGNDFSQYRDQTLARFNTGEADQVQIATPEDRFTLKREKGKWLLEGNQADSASVAGYLNGLSRLHSAQFRDDYQPSQDSPYRLEVWSGDELLAGIEGWPGRDGRLVLRSKDNYSSLMEVESQKWQKEVFPPRDSLVISQPDLY